MLNINYVRMLFPYGSFGQDIFSCECRGYEYTDIQKGIALKMKDTIGTRRTAQISGIPETTINKWARQRINPESR